MPGSGDSILTDDVRGTDSYGGTWLPTWLAARRSEIIALTAVSGTLTAFADNPREFILERVLGAIVDMFLRAAEFLIEQIGLVWAPLIDIPAAVLSPIFSAGAGLAGALSSVLLTINASVVTVASAAGPAAPLVVVTVYALLGIALTWALAAVLGVIKWI